MRWLSIALVASCTFSPGTVVEDAEADGPPGDAKPIDARPADARICPPAPAGSACTLFTCDGSSSCYYVCGNTSNIKFSWFGAVASCPNAGLGCIVTINDQAEQDCITTHTTPVFASYVWIGFYQSPIALEPDQGWSWQCGNSNYLSPNWGQGEPNNQGDEDCAALTGGGGWFDATCTGTARMVCELP